MPSKTTALEQELEDTAQRLLAPLGATVEVLVLDDLGAVVSGGSEPGSAHVPQSDPALDETSEIELTAEQMDALLEGRWQP